ncbi:tRNA lysidine(34) synthetase TilS [Paraglaciecola sp. MB-3u-78]|uniref:tRNA lysidine(34) synthetase TilS n=1 Tax=Paraglaciecola sp. MB-3u-78 TaxID=2058332 RepID=UPI000C31EACB|nr:tRNA lysidine(34) synthetase TilS [Paraglaciecola sp. MB-3u-78]PKG96038.1 tRNA lysidine(34) synthetase TilS [Paraglaciecola sp. MB-3u-78]
MSVLNTLREQLSCEPLLSATHIFVAYSGGVDSHVLLHALHSVRKEAELDFQLSAIHIHHGLSQHADQWQTHCQQVCSQLDIPFQTANVSVEALPRQSLEAQAREARYNKLVELAPDNSQVVLGQHQDDQLETFLLQLKRGAGPKGLSAMNRGWVSPCPLQPDKQVGFYRPLLDTRQQVILDYAQQHNLKWCEDESNQNTDFERNFLRHDVLPVLQQRWPEISRSVARSAALCAEQQRLLDEVCAEKLKQIQASANSLHLPALKELSQSWLHQVVRYWLSVLGIQSPSLAVLNQLMPEVLDAADDAMPILQWNGWQFRRFDQQLFVIRASLDKVSIHKVWQDEKSIKLPGTMGHLTFIQTKDVQMEDMSQLTVNPNLGPILIRSGAYSVRFKPAGSNHSKPLKQWFKQWKVAPWLRDSVLLVIQNEQVLGLLIEGCWQIAHQGDIYSENEPQCLIKVKHYTSI